MFILIIIFPLLSFFCGFFFGGYVGLGACFIGVFSVVSSLILSIYLFVCIIMDGVVFKIALNPWIITDSLTINWCFCFDSLTSVMLIVVTFISTLVHLYSTEYMKEDPHLFRFMSYLYLFTYGTQQDNPMEFKL